MDIQPHTVWLKGPDFLKQPQSEWPINTTEDDTAIPQRELKAPNRISHTNIEYFGDDNDKLADWVKERCSQTLSLRLAKSVIVRCLRASGKADYNNVLRISPSADELNMAMKLILLTYMKPTAEAWKNGRLTTLNPWNLKGIIYTKGRYSEPTMLKLLGVTKLPIIMADTRAAELIMWDAHTRDHARDINGLMARV